MATDLSASIPCVTPVRVPISALGNDPALAPPASPAAPLPACPRPDCPWQAAAREYRWQAGYWQGMHRKATQRLQQLRDDNDALQARIRYLEGQLYGSRADTPAHRPDAPPAGDAPAPQPPKRPRGQQTGKPGPKRRDHAHLPAVEEVRDLPPDGRACPHCGLPLQPCLGTEDSTLLEVEVRPYRRLIRRKRYRRTCSCPGQPGIVTAPAAPKLIPKTIFGVSVWVELLLDKYRFYRPTYRLLADWDSHGLHLSLGSLTDGLQRLLPLFEPLYEALLAHSRGQSLWHADETRWLVFATQEGKVGWRWWLWLFRSPEVACFVLAAGRAHDVPEGHLGPDARGILVADRFAAYPAMAQVKGGAVILALCWAHQRRDFLRVAKEWPPLEAWGLAWVERIGELYRLNEARLRAKEDPEAFAAADKRLREGVRGFREQARAELEQEGLHPACAKVLAGMAERWAGLTVFVEHAEVPMDNNTAERAERGPVVGRKNYYGSGAVWSGRLAAMLFSIFETLALWGLNPRRWLQAYLQRCAEEGGRAPAELGPFLPWSMSAEQRQQWAQKPQGPDSS